MSTKREFLKALAGGKLDQARNIKQALIREETDEKTEIVYYPTPMALKPTKEQARDFKAFCKRMEKKYLGAKIIYITVVDRKPPE